MNTPDGKEVLAALNRISLIPMQLHLPAIRKKALNDFLIVKKFIEEVNSLSEPMTIKKIMQEQNEKQGYKSGGKYNHGGK